MINWRPGVPRHRQIAATIRRRIESGDYADGHLISERSIKEEFGVATTTARKAIALLREQGLIWTAPNLGSFVGQPSDDADI